jgi:uncharacterized protein YbaR (Trm112 family)
MKEGKQEQVLSPELLAVLVCPEDHGELEYLKEQNKLVCKTCKKEYIIENGMPKMLGE